MTITVENITPPGTIVSTLEIPFHVTAMPAVVTRVLGFGAAV